MSTPGLALCGASLPATVGATLPPTASHIVEFLAQLKNVTPSDLELPTEHIIHGGMYARTVRMPAGSVIYGALIKVPTVVIVHGDVRVVVGAEVLELKGYNVFAACALRAQAFVATSPVEITMIFPSKMKAVEDCEREFTDEHEQLVSRRQNSSKVTITGE